MVKLNDISTVLLADEVDYAEFFQAIQDFRIFLLDLTELRLDDDSLRNDVHSLNLRQPSTAVASNLR